MSQVTQYQSLSPSRLLLLPRELLNGIFAKTGFDGLISLSRVCKMFHEVAASVLYRFMYYGHHADSAVMTHRSLEQFVAMTNTILTSDYNYGRFVKDLVLGSEYSAEVAGHRVNSVKKEAYSHDSGRNLICIQEFSLTYLPLRWDIPVEVTPSLFKALGRVPHLQVLHIRFPPPLRLKIATEVVTPSNYPTHPHHHLQPGQAFPHGPLHISPDDDIRFLRDLEALKDPRNFSLFSNLQELSALDIGILGYVPEIAKCISRSSSTLRSLKLSFSDERAVKARRKAENANAAPSGNAFALAARTLPLDPAAHRELKIQERTLSTIFGLKISAPQERVNRVLGNYFHAEDQSTVLKAEVQNNRDHAFVTAARQIAQAMPLLMIPNPESSLVAQVLLKMDKACSMFLSQGPNSFPTANADSSHAALPSGSVLPEISGSTSTAVPASALTDHTTNVDIKHPDMLDEGEDQVFTDAGDASAGISSTRPSRNERAETQSTLPKVREKAVRDENRSNERSRAQTIREYIHSAHGLPLDFLSIHQIPVDAVVLTRGVNVTNLKHLALLNVGPQGPIWAALKKHNSENALELESIHTDQVSKTFLSFVHSLDEVTELFIIERSPKAKVPTMQPKTDVGIADIRRHILKKHICSLERLVIRNDADDSWVVDTRTARLITTYGYGLSELGIGITPTSFHDIIREIGGFTSLIALQLFLHCRDMCNSMINELHCSVFDNISHYPQLVIEYVGMCYGIHGIASNSIIEVNSEDEEDEPNSLRSSDPRAETPMSDNEEDIPASVQGSPSQVAQTGGANREGPGITAREKIRSCDLTNIKMWEAAMWNFKL
ncbi:hypothetical protein EYZ11_005881 [Aspergillus tanneri]|uniref:F-box domain-containing protein n=1 Tax=Aspergillus tanneri TaxID=1220188 RepID=A0A4S3JGT2_9EURO|nr:hypothetical protein EYZ11_005881 [Aspergillus tanneri]